MDFKKGYFMLFAHIADRIDVIDETIENLTKEKEKMVKILNECEDMYIEGDEKKKKCKSPRIQIL